MMPSLSTVEERAIRKARIALLIIRAENDSFGGCPSVGEEAAEIIRSHRNRMEGSNGGGNGGGSPLLPDAGYEEDVEDEE